MVPGQRWVTACASAPQSKGPLATSTGALVQSSDLLAPDRDTGDFPPSVTAVENTSRSTASAPCRHAGGLGGGQQAAHHLHFDFQKAGRGIRALGLQRVRADQLRKARAL